MYCSETKRRDIWTSKSGPNPGIFHILISTCTSRYNGMYFFDISTSKSGAIMWYFAHADFQICFVSQRPVFF